MTRHVEVLNPPDGGSRFLTRKRAESLVASRDARWNDPIARTAIWFKATPTVLAERESRRLHREGAVVVWKPKESAGAIVMQLVRR